MIQEKVLKGRKDVLNLSARTLLEKFHFPSQEGLVSSS